ncbi:pyridoxamine 5'-phosphate oxidase family protein [Bacillus thermotolerans]|nr:pyridoxamine 5'-phosphate oxidase family protein [Bacillus thermotolerans]
MNLANRVETHLVPELFEALQEDRLVTVATIDHESGGPTIHAISWIRAFDEYTLRLAADRRSRIVQNIKHQSAVAVHLLANESAYSITGNGKVLTENVDSLPVPMAIIELKVSEIRDVMFYGSKVVAEPKHQKTYDKRAAERLDQQVIEALKKGADA